MAVIIQACVVEVPMPSMLDLVRAPLGKNWGTAAEEALAEFAEGRYGKKWKNKLQIRVNGETSDDAAPFAALIPAGQPKSGPYGGISFVLFPSAEAPAFVSLVIGTNGLSPDEEALGRPGHIRQAAAICRWLNNQAKAPIAWAKHDPVRIDLSMPRQVRDTLAAYENAVSKYEKMIYALCRTEGTDPDVIQQATLAFCDLVAEERGLALLKSAEEEMKTARAQWMAHVLPVTTRQRVHTLLAQRRFVVLEGPPGTGKTLLARQLLQNEYHGHGRTIQFHPETTYETFIGGLAPRPGTGDMGLRFDPRPGQLMEAAAEALSHPKQPYLLHIDEINRADLAKVLGEAIYLFEPTEPDRSIVLPHDFGPPFGREFRLPLNLHVLGTMNSADRSIAILDIAVRRRFAFLPLWPDFTVLENENASESMKQAFQKLFSIFMEEATDDAFALMPGHAYFMDNGTPATTLLRTGLEPLLREYLLQGYVSGFADSIHAYIDWLGTLE